MTPEQEEDLAEFNTKLSGLIAPRGTSFTAKQMHAMMQSMQVNIKKETENAIAEPWHFAYNKTVILPESRVDMTDILFSFKRAMRPLDGSFDPIVVSEA